MDEGGKEFIVDGPNEGCDVGGVEVIQILEFVEIDLVFTLTTEHGIDRGISSLAAVKSAGGGWRGVLVTPLDSKVAGVLK